MRRAATILWSVARAMAFVAGTGVSAVLAAGCRGPSGTADVGRAPSAAHSTGKPASHQPALEPLERALHGAWGGIGPCDGTLTFRPDGTYERRHYSPGGYRVGGTWVIRWDALPPTLVLTCETSDGPHLVGRTVAVKLVRLDGDALAYQHAGERPRQYARGDAQPAATRPAGERP